MLIFTRRVDERIMIGEHITITVVEVRGNQVRLGINAPKNIAVHRKEVYMRIKRGNGTARAVPAAQPAQQR